MTRRQWPTSLGLRRATRVLHGVGPWAATLLGNGWASQTAWPGRPWRGAVVPPFAVDLTFVFACSNEHSCCGAVLSIRTARLVMRVLRLRAPPPGQRGASGAAPWRGLAARPLCCDGAARPTVGMMMTRGHRGSCWGHPSHPYGYLQSLGTCAPTAPLRRAVSDGGPCPPFGGGGGPLTCHLYLPLGLDSRGLGGSINPRYFPLGAISPRQLSHKIEIAFVPNPSVPFVGRIKRIHLP